MEKWIKEAKEKIEIEAELAVWSCEQLAERENLEKEWVMEEFAKEFAKIKQRGSLE